MSTDNTIGILPSNHAILNVAAMRVSSSVPSAYRLIKKLDGTLVLQGAYQWSQGIAGGHDWKDIPTEVEGPGGQG